LAEHVDKSIAGLFTTPIPHFFYSDEKTKMDVTLYTNQRDIRCTIEFNPINSADNKRYGFILFLKEQVKRNMEAHRIAGNRVYYHFEDMIGQDEQFINIIELAKLVADSDTRILIQGESGTGKELLAQSIHNARTERKGPFVPINCAAIPRELIESDLFGYAPGSFTGATKEGRPGKLEIANSGTIFFDEIGDMPWDMQTKLLRVLQDNYVMRIGSNEEI
jgi:transcriptional regulator with PAS, ATPase and Fis domain